VAVVTFSVAEIALVPKFLNPDPKKFQIRILSRLWLTSMQPKFSYAYVFT